MSKYERKERKEKFMQYSDDIFSELCKKISEVPEIHENCTQAIASFRELAEQYQKSLKPLSKMQQPYNEIIKPLSQLSSAYTDSLSSIKRSITSIVSTENILADQHENLSNLFFSSLAEPISNLSSIYLKASNVSFDSSNIISFAENDVIISDDVLTSISNTIEVPPECARHKSEKENFSRISIKDFFTSFLRPFLLMIIPMLYSGYLNSLNALEAEKESLKAEAYQERSLQLEEDILETNEQILNYLNQISDALNDFQESQQSSSEKEDDSPPLQFDVRSDEESAAPNVDAPNNSDVFDNTD